MRDSEYIEKIERMAQRMVCKHATMPRVEEEIYVDVNRLGHIRLTICCEDPDAYTFAAVDSAKGAAAEIRRNGYVAEVAVLT